MVLDKLCEYFLYNKRHEGERDVPDMDIPPELCLELLMAADYLDGKFTIREWVDDVERDADENVQLETVKG